jgi:hypothetical protein
VTVLPAQRMTPVRRKESRLLPFFFRFGNPTLRPFRLPFLESVKLRSARSRSRNAS